MKISLIILISIFTFSTSGSTADSGLSDEKIKAFFAKLPDEKKQEVLKDCKDDLGSAATGKTDAQIVDLCIANARKNIDPLDNYIDPDTLIDYDAEFETYNEDKKKLILNRCTMFVIQNEMGQTGEAAMSTSEIETYESRVYEKCEAILNKHMWGKDCTESNQKECERVATLDGRLYEVERTGNLLTYALDRCVERMKTTEAHCESDGGILSPTCTLDFRRQCYDFITQESTYLEDPNRELYTCANFEDQTRTIALECRSYCYQKKVCEITDDNFINRIIGNIYLRKKKGKSSCVKDKSFGVAGDNKIWVHQSCHGEFGIQYKDPDCGYRPTCDVSPFEPESIDVRGQEETFVTCDGNDSPNPNDTDPRKNTESTGTVWCKAHLYKKDKNGKLTDEIDESRYVSRIYSINLEEKLGPHRCNPGGNGSPVDYLSKKKDGEWGIEVINYCHARFKATVAWEQKQCTMAGKETTNKNTCCKGLVHDPETKICNVPEYVAPPLEEISLIPEISIDEEDKNRCKQELSEDVISQAKSFFSELAAYENMFTILDGKSDPINKISLESNTKEEEPLSRTLDNKAIKLIHDASLNFRTAYAQAKIGHEELTNKIICDMNEFLLIRSAEFGAIEKKNFDNTGKKCKGFEDKLEQALTFLKYIEETKNGTSKWKGDPPTLPPFSEENLLKEQVGIQEGSQAAQEYLIDANIGYSLALLDAFDNYILELDKASIEGQNLVWYCAHKENCSEYSWLVKHAKADQFNNKKIEERLKYRVVTDLLLNPIFPSKLLSSRSSILPELEVGYKKYLYDNENYHKTEKEISEFDVYRPVIDYLAGKKEEISQPEWYKKIFQLYSHEFPLRENSVLQKDEMFKDFQEVLSATTKFNVRSEDEESIQDSIPRICEKQSRTNYQVRVPLGKALIPLRMAQVVEYLHKYVEAQGKIFMAQRTCTVNYDKDDSNVKTGGTVRTGLGNTNMQGGVIKELDGLTGKSFGDKLGKILTVKNSPLGSTNPVANKVMALYQSNKVASGKISSGDKFNKDIINERGTFALSRQKREEATKKLVERSKKKRNDNLIGNYVNSLDKAYGSKLKSKDNSFFSKLSNLFLNNGAQSLNKKGSGSPKQDVDINDSRYGNSNGASGSSWQGGGALKDQSRRSGGYGNNSNSNSYGSEYGVQKNQVTGLTERETKKILSESKKSKYNKDEGDSLFDVITKRYIKSAYPHLIDFRKKKDIE